MGKSQIKWDDETWNKLADAVWKMLPKNPDCSIVALTNRAMEQLPAEQRRTIKANAAIGKLLERLSARMSEAQAAVIEVERLKQSLASRQTADELLGEISDDELVRLYSGRILAKLSADDVLSHYTSSDILAAVDTPKLCGIAVERLLGAFSEHRASDALRDAVSYGEEWARSTTEPRSNGSPRINKPVVAILGLMPQQVHDLNKRCPGAIVARIDNSVDSFPRHAELYIAWTRFTNHSAVATLKKAVAADRFCLCSGGLTSLARVINNRLNPVGAK